MPTSALSPRSEHVAASPQTVTTSAALPTEEPGIDACRRGLNTLQIDQFWLI